MTDGRNTFYERQELQLSVGRQARTIQDLLNIRAANSHFLREHAVGSAIGVRRVDGRPTDIPAVIAFVSFKVAPKWVPEGQLLPRTLEGRGSTWCDLDVMEFNPDLYDHEPREAMPPDSVFNELVDKLRGGSDVIGPGCQLMSPLGKFCTMGPLVDTNNGSNNNNGAGGPRAPEGFLATASLLEGLSEPIGMTLYHPQTPHLGTGTALGTVEDVAEAVPDIDWYGTYICELPDVTVQTDAAYVAFRPELDMTAITSEYAGVPGKIGPMFRISLDMVPQEIIGKRVAKVGRTTGLTYGSILAYATEYYISETRVNVVDLMVEADDGKEFSKRGDAGATVFMIKGWPPPAQGASTGHGEEVWRPLALVWAFSKKCGRSHYGRGVGPSYWSSGVDLSRLLHVLRLKLHGAPSEH